MHIRISYYAILREQRGIDQETIQVSTSSLRQLYQGLERKHHFPLSERFVRPAINDDFCDWDRPLVEGDHVAFLPPVAGG